MSTSTSPFPILPPDGHRGGNQPSPSHNHHPYAIKTTSTALLTRSNTTSQNSQNPHYYIPSSPSPSSKHRFSKSETSIDIANAAFSSGPRPLPVPPNLTDQREPTTPESRPKFWRTRAETLPATTSPSQVSTPMTPSGELDNLPSNPRAWTTSQLASYLVTALRVRSGETHPLPHQVTRDIAAFVKEARLTGRTFLRLSESDLEQMGVNNLWRTALLDAARNLRQNVLKGRIWGFNDEAPQTPPKKSPFSNSHYNSSSSSIDEEDEPTPSPPKGSRVRGMVATLERSASQSDGDEQGDLFNPSPSKHHHYSKRNRNLATGSEGDDEATFSRASHHRRPDLNDSPSSSGSERPLPLTPDVDPFLVDDGPVKRTTSPFQIPESELTVKELLLRSPHDIDMEYEYSAQERAKRLAKIDVETARADGVHRGRLIGAEAWEQIDLVAGATVKRAPASPEKDVSGAELNSQRPLPLPPVPSGPVNTPARKGYTMPPKDAGVQTDAELQTDSIVNSKLPNNDVGVQTIAEIVHEPEVNNTSQVPSLKETISPTRAEEEAQLQLHIQSTRTLLEAFRLRLELVEKHVDDMVRREEQRELAAFKDALARNDVDLPSIPTDTTLVSHCEIASQPTGDHEVLKDVSDDEDTQLHITQSNPDPDCKVTDLGVPGRTSSSWLDLARAGDGGVYGSTASAQGDAWDPLDGGLPTYVFMVGVGVCVVVLQTVVRRWATRKT
ncbi:hypothetical protein BD410DRAFT_826222 [Rickenella mellea]|uniref:SAM domain-containing protein n=1 Tax=Rickenella mellea TaxID=50990 RepID=A0A4Y7QED1_9AGAM|nr:hypothetical protein BD410DRAFT_826222 [Rickenella mellea]